MSIILDPLLENPDSYQVAFTKKILTKIKNCDDGLAATMLSAAAPSSSATAAEQASAAQSKKTALQNLYYFNKVIFIHYLIQFFVVVKN